LTTQRKTKNYLRYDGSRFITVHSLDNSPPPIQLHTEVY